MFKLVRRFIYCGVCVLMHIIVLFISMVKVRVDAEGSESVLSMWGKVSIKSPRGAT